MATGVSLTGITCMPINAPEVATVFNSAEVKVAEVALADIVLVTFGVPYPYMVKNTASFAFVYVLVTVSELLRLTEEGMLKLHFGKAVLSV